MAASAMGDLDAARALALHEEISDRIIGFHLQQCVEKGLKAALIATNTKYPLTHDLKLLFELLRPITSDFEKFRQLSELTDFAVTLRYSFESDWGEDFEGTGLIEEVTGFVRSLEAYLDTNLR